MAFARHRIEGERKSPMRKRCRRFLWRLSVCVNGLGIGKVRNFLIKGEPVDVNSISELGMKSGESSFHCSTFNLLLSMNGI